MTRTIFGLRYLELFGEESFKKFYYKNNKVIIFGLKNCQCDLDATSPFVTSSLKRDGIVCLKIKSCGLVNRQVKVKIAGGGGEDVS